MIWDVYLVTFILAFDDGTWEKLQLETQIMDEQCYDYGHYSPACEALRIHREKIMGQCDKKPIHVGVMNYEWVSWAER